MRERWRGRTGREARDVLSIIGCELTLQSSEVETYRIESIYFVPGLLIRRARSFSKRTAVLFMQTLTSDCKEIMQSHYKVEDY